MKTLPLILFVAIGLTACVDSENVSNPPLPNQQLDLMDQDSDGVINARDLCADTILGATINNDGCPRSVGTEEVKRLVTLFENDKTNILPEYYPAIEKMAEFLGKYPDTRLELRGHASKTGPSAHNVELSQQRAQVVYDALVNKYGVNPEQLEIVWFGDENPVVEGATENVHAQNRRVVGTVVGEYTDSEMAWTIYTAQEKK